jgi:hypothetical protein
MIPFVIDANAINAFQQERISGGHGRRTQQWPQYLSQIALHSTETSYAFKSGLIVLVARSHMHSWTGSPMN